MKNANRLRLQAMDQSDLTVLSAALQDGIALVGDIKFDNRARSLSLVLARFRWELADYGKGERVGAALRIDGVMNVRSRGINRSDPEARLVLLSMDFVAGATAPEGMLTLTFAGGGELALEVEAIDVMLLDVTEPRSAKSTPNHDISDA